MLNLAIVNDTEIAVEALRRAIRAFSGYRLLWIAQTGREAVERCSHQRPDLILMDLNMPELNGVEATRQIMQHSPCAILIVTASISRNISKVFEAMGYGALDVVQTPALGTGNPQAVSTLFKKIEIAAKLVYTTAPSQPHSNSPVARNSLSPAPKPISAQLPRLVAIGTSTGGPHALQYILSQLPASFNAAIIVIQHINEKFAPGLVDWLNQSSALPVSLARNGDRPIAGRVLIAGTNDHLIMRANRTLRYSHEPAAAIHRPSVDVFFSSVARHWQTIGTALLLTGMGRDGAAGMGLLRSAGWHTIAESADSCVVFGMPKAAIEQQTVTQVLPLSQIVTQLTRGVADDASIH